MAQFFDMAIPGGIYCTMTGHVCTGLSSFVCLPSCDYNTTTVNVNCTDFYPGLLRAFKFWYSYVAFCQCICTQKLSK